ncbi:Ig-like domain-containing protein [Solirubrobacter soli]|uniref:Ig-like domain-containing protein n=1 Tax=Solirubrobacter soli TaxID=363832 RepID=UPI00042542FE|nr:Ig-like domain-containing protein [Solirubrobacter soli]
MKALLLTGAMLAFAAPAQAATLVNSNGTLTYTGTAAVNDISLYGTDTVTVGRGYSDADPIAVSGCSRVEDGLTTERYACAGVTTVAVDTGAGDDRIDLATKLVQTVAAGPGDDTIWAGRGTIGGGSGIDVVRVYPGDHATPLSFSLDGTANDGAAAANILPDVEDLTIEEPISFSGTPGSYGPNVVIGSDAANELTGGNGADTITGGGGSDTLSGSHGDDVIDARDGVADRVSCGPGADTVLADSIDQVGEDCESVQVTAVAPFTDKPPTADWKSPAATLAPNAPATLEVTAGDDFGVASVRFLDDDRTLCTVTAPPYTCKYEPRLQDIGPNLLVVVATDSVGQTTTISRLATVSKFTPTAVTVKTQRRGGRSVVSGKVTLPAGARCGGTVTVSAKGVPSRTIKLSARCTYRVTIATRSAARFKARFDGTKTLAAKRSA